MSIELVQTPIRTDFQANKITITARDSVTGRVIERVVPVIYKENRLGIWLEGEDELGDPQAVVVFTAAGRSRLEDLLAINYSEEGTDEWTQNSLKEI
ncbi:hypothetical protein [Paenibacillus sp. P32E]|uniref:hypothetical protein n=1 Tax=Paenibacillus sp. P32E TaxID=1349434 RepID=UPI00093F2C4E|nr:hypothetical protein [Paenibacillus sp. P32E]OKP94787.1 hypothetical protein A3848_02100 [Paenibacillus sp. P32E]